MRGVIILFVSALLAHAEVTYKVRLTANDGNRIVELRAEEYVAGVLAGESSTFQSEEALKAMAVAARTYAARLRGRHSAEGFDFCATTHCQRVELRNVSARLKNAVAASAGELLWFEGKPAFAVYTRDCGGKTEAVDAVWPDVQASYLGAHSDPYCTRGGVSVWTWKVRPEEIVRALTASRLEAPPSLRRIVISRRTESGRAHTLELNGEKSVPISAGSFRFALGRELGWNTLRSNRYEIGSGDGEIHFRGSGQGHGVGLCQVGADQMGSEGRTYREILAFYYPGTAVSRLATGFHWIRLGGEGVAVFTTRPDRDRDVLASAEQAKRYAESRLHMSAPAETTVRVYPDVDSFRNATGEPGWVAAHSSGTRIDLQALREAKPVLKHEMLHLVLESHAVAGVPVWFREGLVEWLSGENSRAVAEAANLDGDLRQRQERGNAERAYAQAAARIRGLIDRYGEATVLGWVESGLPADVRNSSANNDRTKSK